MNMVTLPVSTIEKVEKRLKIVLEELSELKKNQVSKRTKSKKTIKFWTKEQWEKAEREADEDIKAGRVKRFDSVEDLIADLHS